MNDYPHKDMVKEMFLKPAVGNKLGVIRLQMVREEKSLYGVTKFSDPKMAADMMRPLLSLADREMLIVMSVNIKMEPLAVEIVAVGSLNTCVAEPREIFKHAILNNAAGIVCFHNHPSGEADPSRTDNLMTKRLKKAGDLLGIPVIDHIIVAGEDYYSFKEDDNLVTA